MIVINNLIDLISARSHPYRGSEFLTDDTQIFTVSDDDNENEALIEGYEEGELFYRVHWEGDDLMTEGGESIKAVYGE